MKTFVLALAFALLMPFTTLAADYDHVMMPEQAEQDFNSVQDKITQTPLTQRIEQDELAGANGKARINPLRNYQRALRSIDLESLDPIRRAVVNRLMEFIDRTVDNGNRTGLWVVYGECNGKMGYYARQREFICIEE